MALHAIWAGLPIELTSLIIERTEHLQTLQNWCIATAGCSELQAAAYRYRYRDIYLDLTNLCQDPAIERKPRKPQKKNKKSKEHTSPWEEEPGLSDLLLEVDKVTSQLPARYIKNLVLDLQQAPEIARNAWATKYGAPDPQWRYVRKEEGYPYVQDAEYTIRRLFSEANNLHSVEQKGPAADLIVNAILTTAAPSCTSFAFRVGGDKEFPFMKRAPGSGRGHGGLHKWTGLESRKGIKSLTLGDLYWPEAHFLATAVRSLECLEDLKITFMKEKAPYGYTEFFVLCFLDTEDENKKDDLKEPRSISNLPNTLRSISLEGCIDHTEVKSMIERYPTTKPYKNLKSLSLNFDVDSPINHSNLGIPSAYMTTWFRDSPLRDVSLPWVDATFLVSKANSYLAVEPDFPSILQTTGRSLTVNGVCLSSRNAFRLTIELPYSLAPTFTLRSFVVGTRTYEFLQSNRANSNSHEGDRQQISEDLCLWKDWEVVNTLHHLRLEQVELDRLSLEHFDFDKIQELKILMLYPWPHTDSNWGHGRMYATSTNDPDACTSLPKEGNEEARLLGEIIRAASKTLRVLFVGSYRIWLQRSENGEITAVPFVSARHNEGQRMVMKREFNQADWDFIDSVPIAPVQVLSPPAREHMARLWTRQSMETVKKRTYATFFKQ